MGTGWAGQVGNREQGDRAGWAGVGVGDQGGEGGLGVKEKGDKSGLGVREQNGDSGGQGVG